MNAFKSILAASVIALAAQTAQASDEHEHWIADFDVAVELAKKEKKDLLVDFTGSDWCGWCIKLHEEVFDHESFLKPALENYILVSLDFPSAEELKALVPNPKRNDELQAKYEVEGFPTILLMTADGEVFGRTGYRPGGPEAYIEHMTALASEGKPAIIEAKKLVAAVEHATEEARDVALEAVIAKLAELGPGSPPAAMLIPLVKQAVDRDPTNSKGLKSRAIVALLKAGAADEQHLLAARELDPKNEQGMLELVVGAQFISVRDDTSAKAALAALKALPNIKDKQAVAALFATAARWLHGPLQDKAAAKEYAQNAIDLGLKDEALLKALEAILSGE